VLRTETSRPQWPGKLYLASPYVVAASAIAGKIVEPFEFLRKPEEQLTTLEA